MTTQFMVNGISHAFVCVQILPIGYEASFQPKVCVLEGGRVPLFQIAHGNHTGLSCEIVMHSNHICNFVHFG